MTNECKKEIMKKIDTERITESRGIMTESCGRTTSSLKSMNSSQKKWNLVPLFFVYFAFFILFKKNKKRKMRYIKYILILLIIALSCTGCNVPHLPENDSKQTVKLAVTSRSQAREIVRDYLSEKYQLPYIVQIPYRNEAGDFQVQAYPEGFPNKSIYAAVDAESGECRDSGCKEIVETYLEKQLESLKQTNWEKSRIQILCSFWDDVPEHVWDTDTEPQDIIQTETMHCQIFLMIADAAPDKEQEAKKIKNILADGSLYGLRITLEGYYVDDAVYTESEKQMTDGRAMMFASCGKDYADKATMRWFSGKEPLLPETIISSFSQ